MTTTTISATDPATPPATAAATPTAAPATTPTLRAAWRRVSFWVAVAVFAILVAGAAAIVRGGGATGQPLGATNPAPTGAMAVVNVLRAQGVTVITADTLADARAAVGNRADTSVLVYDPDGYLDERHLTVLRSLSATTVLVRPDFRVLLSVAPYAVTSGSPVSATAGIGAHCDLPAAVKARRISAPQSTYRLSATATAADTGCFPSTRGRFAVVAHDGGGRQVTVVGSTDVFDNENIVREGNAALALNLLGAHHRLVWYLPTLADATATGTPSLGQLTPGWVTPVILLLIAAVIAAAVWRGRRFGPLVVEYLPVVVRAEETMEGRARLYQRSSARLRAVDALRIGAVARIASRCGLPRSARIIEVIGTAAVVTGFDPRTVNEILVTGLPRSESDLIALTRRLTDFEIAVERATGTPPRAAAFTTDQQ